MILNKLSLNWVDPINLHEHWEQTISPEEQYRKLGGESESRLVQDRLNMTMQERMNDPFYKNYDVPLDQQIIRFK